MKLCEEAAAAYRASGAFNIALDLDVYYRQHELAEGTPTNLYFIYEGEGHVFKIGLAINPPERLSNLQQATYRTLTLYAAVPGTLRLERYLHHVCRRDRIRGEWFRASRRVLALADTFRGIQEMLAEYREEEGAPDRLDTLALLSSRSSDLYERGWAA